MHTGTTSQPAWPPSARFQRVAVMCLPASLHQFSCERRWDGTAATQGVARLNAVRAHLQSSGSQLGAPLSALSSSTESIWDMHPAAD